MAAYNNYEDMTKYLAALMEMTSRLPEFKSFADELEAMEDWQARAKAFYDSDFAKMLALWRKRMTGRFLELHNELGTTQAALCLAWRALPGDTYGIFILLRFLAEDAETHDLQMLLEDSSTLTTIKTIAQHDFGTNRRLGREGFGEWLKGHAKAILARASRNADYGAVTTSRLAHALHSTQAHSFGTADSLSSMMRNLLRPLQPARAGSGGDQRRICDAAGCTNVEGTVKFKKCAACHSVAYCSKKCQVDAWKAAALTCRSQDKLQEVRNQAPRQNSLVCR